MRGSEKIEAVTPRLLKNQRSTPVRSLSASDFQKTFEEIFGARESNEKVNEEEVFAAVTRRLVSGNFGASSARKFNAAFQLNRNLLELSGNHSTTEVAARKALRFLEKSGDISADDRATLYDTAFQISQLDRNSEKLYDSIGGEGDPTRAVMSFQKVGNLVSERLEGMQITLFKQKNKTAC